ncbi:cytochrome c [Myxococcota bacterium]|nr:cytochrome c [Myxococcota bacterium]
MVAWKKWLKVGGGTLGGGSAMLGGVVFWAGTTGEQDLQFPDWPMPELAASTDPEVIERGRYLAYGPAHCAICHTGEDRDHPERVMQEPFDGGLEFAMGPLGTRYAPNLTPDPETGIGRYTDAEVARAIRTGVLPSGELSVFMSVSVGELSDQDLVAVLSFLRSLPPVRNEVRQGSWSFLTRAFLRLGLFGLEPRPLEGPAHVPPGDEPSVERGKYLADHVAFCQGCHSPVDMATFRVTGPPYSGGNVEPSHGADTEFEYAPTNLTPSPTGYVGKVDEDAFVARLRGGRQHLTSIMPWENFGTMTDADLRSIYRYLKTVPPVDRDTGPGYREIGSWP